jgi:hypothetical protein
VSLTLEEVKRPALIEPAVLQCGMAKLHDKVDFACQDILIEVPTVIAFTGACKPELGRLSLDNNLRLNMQSYLGISPAEPERCCRLVALYWGQ